MPSTSPKLCAAEFRIQEPVPYRDQVRWTPSSWYPSHQHPPRASSTLGESLPWLHWRRTAATNPKATMHNWASCESFSNPGATTFLAKSALCGFSSNPNLFSFLPSAVLYLRSCVSHQQELVRTLTAFCRSPTISCLQSRNILSHSVREGTAPGQ